MSKFVQRANDCSQTRGVAYHSVGSFIFLVGFLLLSLCLLACQIVTVPSTHPTPTSISTSTCLSQLNPVPFPASSSLQKSYNDTAILYFSLVLHQNFHKAYLILGTALRMKEAYASFIKDINYVLSKENWKMFQIVGLQQEKGRNSWTIGMELYTLTPSKNRTIWYYWNIYMEMERNRPVISQIGLYPTGVSC